MRIYQQRMDQEDLQRQKNNTDRYLRKMAIKNSKQEILAKNRGAKNDLSRMHDLQ